MPVCQADTLQTSIRSLGMMETTGVLRQIPQVDPVPLSQVLGGASTAFATLNGCTPADDSARFLLAECHNGLSRGFAGPLMTT